MTRSCKQDWGVGSIFCEGSCLCSPVKLCSCMDLFLVYSLVILLRQENPIYLSTVYLPRVTRQASFSKAFPASVPIPHTTQSENLCFYDEFIAPAWPVWGRVGGF